ncbi:MAG: hypothetical protein RR835_00375 [Peptostreptococcaceae bacterium]
MYVKKVIIIKIIASITYFAIMYMGYLKRGSSIFDNTFKLVSIIIIGNLIISIYNYKKEKLQK